MKFQTTVLLGGKTATGIQVPEEIVTALASGKKPAVTVSIGEYTYRTTVAVMDGKFMIPLSEEHRTKAGLAAGDSVEVDLELDTQPRVLDIPPDFTTALDQVPVARQFFDSLSYSNKRRFVLQIEDAKTPETRQRRIEKSVSMLKEGRV